MKIILLITLSIFAFGAYAGCETAAERKVDFKLEGTDTSVSKDVCAIQNGDKSEHKARYAECDCKNRVIASEKIEGSETDTKTCDLDRIEVDYVYDEATQTYKKSKVRQE